MHYDDLVEGRGVEWLERALGVRLERGFADSRLSHAAPDAAVPAEAEEIYGELCAAAGVARPVGSA